MNTHHARMTFGKYHGELLTRVPYGYLVWGVSVKNNGKVLHTDGTHSEFHEAAKEEISRRGERIPDVDISPHAIDRISQRALKHWRRVRKDGEGLYTWAQRMVIEALDDYVSQKAHGLMEKGTITIGYEKVRWVIQTNYAIPVLKTVKDA